MKKNSTIKPEVLMEKIFLTLEKTVFYFLLFTLPFNIRKSIFSWGQYFNEYQTAFIYATDVLIIAILFLWLLRHFISKFPISNFQFPNKFKIPNIKIQNSIFYILYSIFLIWCFVSLFWTDNVGLGFYKWLRLLEFSAFFLYIKHNLKNYGFKKIAWTIAGTGIIQSIIAIVQFAGQKSVGLPKLGESTFGWGIAGTATFRLLGAKIVRASATFPHANLLAAFLLISLFFLFYLYLARRGTTRTETQNHADIRGLIRETLYAVSFYLLILAVILTFSRSAILLALLFIPLMFLWLFLNKPLRAKYLLNSAKLLVILTCIGSFLVLIFFNFLFARADVSLKEAAISDRLTYNQMAWDLIKQNPLQGIGLGNYIWHLNQNNAWHQYGLLYPYLFQPVHNIYLLIASEIGLIGLILFFLLIFFILKIAFSSNKNSLYSIFYILYSIFLFWGFSDHFFWTLNQGQLMWWFILGILMNSRINEFF